VHLDVNIIIAMPYLPQNPCQLYLPLKEILIMYWYYVDY